jgi:hypothetical protein
MTSEPKGTPGRRADDKEQAANPMTGVEPQGTSPRRALVWGLLTAAVVAIAGFVAEESFGTIASCSAVSALFMAWPSTCPARSGPSQMAWAGSSEWCSG